MEDTGGKRIPRSCPQSYGWQDLGLSLGLTTDTLLLTPFSSSEKLSEVHIKIQGVSVRIRRPGPRALAPAPQRLAWSRCPSPESPAPTTPRALQPPRPPGLAPAQSAPRGGGGGGGGGAATGSAPRRGLRAAGKSFTALTGSAGQKAAGRRSWQDGCRFRPRGHRLGGADCHR